MHSAPAEGSADGSVSTGRHVRFESSEPIDRLWTSGPNPQNSGGRDDMAATLEFCIHGPQPITAWAQRADGSLAGFMLKSPKSEDDESWSDPVSL